MGHGSLVTMLPLLQEMQGATSHRPDEGSHRALMSRHKSISFFVCLLHRVRSEEFDTDSFC
jgi:hypothetical protein